MNSEYVKEYMDFDQSKTTQAAREILLLHGWTKDEVFAVLPKTLDEKIQHWTDVSNFNKMKM